MLTVFSLLFTLSENLSILAKPRVRWHIQVEFQVTQASSSHRFITVSL